MKICYLANLKPIEGYIGFSLKNLSIHREMLNVPIILGSR